MSGRRIAVPKLVLLAVGALLAVLLCILAIGDSADGWIILLTALVIAAIAGALVLDMRRVIDATGDTATAPAEAPPPGRAIIVNTLPMTAQEVLEAIGPGETRSVMVVCPAGLTGAGLMVDDRDFARAHRSQRETVAALRAAGLEAAGQVGDRNPAHAIDDALGLFPADRVVVVAHGVESDVYREHLDSGRFRRERRVDLQLRDVAAAE